MRLEDEDIRRAQAGHRPSIERVSGEMFAIALSEAQRWRTADPACSPEDVAQDAVMRGLRSLSSFRPSRGPLISWMRTIVRNLLRDRHKLSVTKLCERSASSDELGEMIAADECAHLEDDSAPAIPDQAHWAEASWRIHSQLRAPRANSGLRAFRLRHLGGYKYSQIAELEGVSEGTIKSRIHRAKQALQKSPELRALYEETIG